MHLTMADLIPRAAAIEAFDDDRVDRNYGDVSPESVIKVIEAIPAVDAVPVEWLRKVRNDERLTLYDVEAIDLLLAWWEKEQEAQGT